MATEEIKIRKSILLEDIQSAMDLTRKEQWKTFGTNDAELLYAVEPNGLFTGFVAGEKVSYVSTVFYGEEIGICIVGTFIVDPRHRRRGKGYGLKIWDYAWSRIPKECACVSVMAVQGMAPKFQEKYGLEPAWTDHMFLFDTNKVTSLSVPSQYPITSFQEVKFDHLLKYDASVFGYGRSRFMKKLLECSGCKGWVAYDGTGEGEKVVGYCIVKESNVEGSGWIIGPWYADNATVARALLIKAASEQCCGYLICTIPGVNTEAMSLADSYAKEAAKFTRMFARSRPENIVQNSKHRVFGVYSSVFG